MNFNTKALWIYSESFCYFIIHRSYPKLKHRALLVGSLTEAKASGSLNPEAKAIGFFC
jgi:hypothetical protein